MQRYGIISNETKKIRIKLVNNVLKIKQLLSKKVKSSGLPNKNTEKVQLIECRKKKNGHKCPFNEANAHYLRLLNYLNSPPCLRENKVVLERFCLS